MTDDRKFSKSAVRAGSVVIGGVAVLVAGTALGASNSSLPVPAFDDPALLSPALWADTAGSQVPAPMIVASGGEGGEGGEAGELMHADDAIAYAASLVELAAHIRAGRDALAHDQVADAAAHFDGMINALGSELGQRLGSYDFEVEHVREEFSHVPAMIRAQGTSADVLEVTAHAAYEIDEHDIEIDPGLRRSPQFMLRTAKALMGVAAQQAGAAKTSVEQQYLHGLIAVTYDWLGGVGSALRAQDAAGHDRLSSALNTLLGLTAAVAAEIPSGDAAQVRAQISAVEFEIIALIN